MTIYIGADHRGFEFKEQLKKWLAEQGYQVVDCGNTAYNPEDDFPDFAFAVAERVAMDKDSRGIIACGSGAGINMAANEVRGIRASTAINVDEVRHAREHDDMNVLALSADYQTPEEMIEIVEVFLSATFQPSEKFIRRINKIEQYQPK
jgi:ribose 5-phosphate isomerase B